MNIDKVRTSSRFMRTVASIVLITYSTLIVSPGVQAMQQAEAQETARQQARHAERSNLSKSLASAKDRLRVLAERPDALRRKPTREDRRAAKESLRAWQVESRALIEQVRAEFADTGALLERKQLPEVIRQRHAEAMARFEMETAALDREIVDALTATDAGVEQQKAEAALRRLDRSGLGRSQQEFDPNNLPNGVIKPDRTRVPKTASAAFQAALLSENPSAQFAQAGGFDFSKLPGASNPSYLAPSTEVVLTPDIQAKANELNRSPIEIYNWVRNNVYWQPTWGALQDASHTLSSRRGNAFDIASLTIALLRASGIPARYVHGTIDVPEDKFRNWAGGFQHLDAAVDFASSGGIPVTSVISGGRVTKIRIEHIWVEAAIDFNPSRGVKNRSADSWIAFDPSYKQLEILAGLDLSDVGGFDQNALSQAYVASGTVNNAEGWVTGLDRSILSQAQEQARQSIETFLEQNNPDASVGEVLGGKRIIAQVQPVLPAGLPNKLVVSGATFAAVPASLQQRITFAFGKDIEGEPIDPVTFAWARLNSKQVTLSFRPATPADEEALRALLPPGEITDVNQLPSSIPAYLIRVVPELKLDGEVVMAGSSMTLGSELDFVFTPAFAAGHGRPFSYKLPAGSYLSVASIAGSVDPARLAEASTRLQATRDTFASNDPARLALLTRERVLGDMFHAGTLSYYAQYLALGYIAGLEHQGHHQLAAGVGTYGYEPEVDVFFGVPRRLERGGIAMNIPIVNVVGRDRAAGAGAEQFTAQLGLLSSALEHQIPEHMFSTAAQPVEAISAVKALRKASEAGQRIYQITPANQATTLPLIHHDSATMDEIRSALAAGKTVITHASAVSVPGWSGAGYVLMDEATGAAAWKIGGGSNGAFIAGVVIGAMFMLSIALLILSGPIGALMIPALLLAVESIALTYMLNAGFETEEIRGCFVAGLILATLIVTVGWLFLPTVFIGTAFAAMLAALGVGTFAIGNTRPDLCFTSG